MFNFCKTIWFIPHRSLKKTQLEQGEKNNSEVTPKRKQNELHNPLVMLKQLFHLHHIYLLVIISPIRSVEVTFPYISKLDTSETMPL